MTDHATGCGHNHDPNPYTDPARSTAYGHVVRHLFRLTALTSPLDAKLSCMYAACTLVSLSDPRDRVPTIRALMWELGSLINIMTGGKEPELQVEKCDHDTDEHSPEAEFGQNAMQAFFAAASVGQLQSAVNVVDAVLSEAGNHDKDPDAFAAQFFGNAIASIGFTAWHNVANPLDLFDELNG